MSVVKVFQLRESGNVFVKTDLISISSWAKRAKLSPRASPLSGRKCLYNLNELLRNAGRGEGSVGCAEK